MLPKSGSGRRGPRLAREAAVAAGARGGACVLELAAVVPYEKQNIFHIKTRVPPCCLDLAGLLVQPSLGGELGASRERRAEAWGARESGSWARAVLPRASRFESGRQAWGCGPRAGRAGTAFRACVCGRESAAAGSGAFL